MARVVSMVPSWTETLVEAGVDVVGRTRYCLHPKGRVKTIPVVGGTKNLNPVELKSLAPDLLVLDREENPRWMSELAICPWWSSHIQSVNDVGPALASLSQKLSALQIASEVCGRLNKWSREWELLAQMRAQHSVDQLPGVLEWWRRPEQEVQSLVYVIWKNPWMRIAPNTFIGSMLECLGQGDRLRAAHAKDCLNKYPEFSLETYNARTTLLLFSSEPFPFAQHKAKCLDLGFPCALVDGECFSWFGFRSMKFLQNHLPLA